MDITDNSPEPKGAYMARAKEIFDPLIISSQTSRQFEYLLDKHNETLQVGMKTSFPKLNGNVKKNFKSPVGVKGQLNAKPHELRASQQNDQS
jgi:hypothetical protein